MAIRLSTLRLAPSIITVGISSMLASLVSTALDLTIMCVTGMRAISLDLRIDSLQLESRGSLEVRCGPNWFWLDRSKRS